MNSEELLDQEAPHYLLDSNIVSELIKSDASFSVVQKIAEHNSDCAICATSWHELLYGEVKLQDGARKSFLKNFINELSLDFRIVSYTKKAAEIHAEIRARVEKMGKPAPFADSMIAAVALANRMVLVTGNAKHFSAIQKASGLQVENWLE